MKKLWKQIHEAPDYEISNYGEIRRLTSRTSAKRGRILKPRYVDGYRSACLCIGGKPNYFRVHRLVMAAFVGVSDLPINHKNGVRDDNRLANLEYCTQLQNVHHSRSVLGWQNHGALNGNARLTEVVVRQILSMHASGIQQKTISEQLRVSRGHVCRIVNGKMWGHVSIAPHKASL